MLPLSWALIVTAAVLVDPGGLLVFPPRAIRSGQRPGRVHVHSRKAGRSVPFALRIVFHASETGPTWLDPWPIRQP